MKKILKDEPTVYQVSLCEAFRKVPFLAGLPPLTTWLRQNLYIAYGETYDQVRTGYENLTAAVKDTPAEGLPAHGFSQFRTEGDYKRDRRTYNIMFRFADSWQSLAKIGTPWLPLAEALMLREGMTEGCFLPDERDFNHNFRYPNLASVANCPEMQDWCEEAHNYVELALEYTLYLYEVRRRLRLARKWSTDHVLSRLNQEWGVKYKCKPIDGITDRQWRNATDAATNRAIHKMLDDMTLIEHGEKELPFLSISAQMATIGDTDAPHNYVHIQ